MCVVQKKKKSKTPNPNLMRKNSFSIANLFKSIFSPQCAFFCYFHSFTNTFALEFLTNHKKRNLLNRMELNRVLLIINSNNENEIKTGII